MSKKVLLITGSNRGAGYGIAKYFYEQGYKIISLNRTLKSLLPIFKISKTYITVIGSHAATHYFDGGVAYCSTKAALKAMVEVFIQETRDYGVRTTLINAGAINNRPKGNDDKKLQPESIGKCIFSIVNSNSDVLLGELEIRPSIPLKSNESGISKLQYV